MNYQDNKKDDLGRSKQAELKKINFIVSLIVFFMVLLILIILYM